jgi:hypothetical protein
VITIGEVFTRSGWNRAGSDPGIIPTACTSGYDTLPDGTFQDEWTVRVAGGLGRASATCNRFLESKSTAFPRTAAGLWKLWRSSCRNRRSFARKSICVRVQFRACRMGANPCHVLSLGAVECFGLPRGALSVLELTRWRSGVRVPTSLPLTIFSTTCEMRDSDIRRVVSVRHNLESILPREIAPLPPFPKPTDRTNPSFFAEP